MLFLIKFNYNTVYIFKFIYLEQKFRINSDQGINKLKTFIQG